MTKILIFISIFSAIVAGCFSHKNNESLDPYFDKVIFHTSACFGFCSTYHIEISKDKSFKLFAEEVFTKIYGQDSYKVDPTLSGHYIGQVPDSIFYKLDNELKNIGLDSLVFPDVTCCDLPEVTLIVYYKGKRKYLRSLEFPEKAFELVRQLENICELKNLEKTNEQFIIEK